jgi:hypothetical protein
MSKRKDAQPRGKYTLQIGSGKACQREQAASEPVHLGIFS